MTRPIANTDRIAVELVDAEGVLCPGGYVGELRSIRAVVRYLMGDDQMMLGIDATCTL